jgi:hypothetical protein
MLIFIGNVAVSHDREQPQHDAKNEFVFVARDNHCAESEHSVCMVAIRKLLCESHVGGKRHIIICDVY